LLLDFRQQLGAFQQVRRSKNKDQLRIRHGSPGFDLPAGARVPFGLADIHEGKIGVSPGSIEQE
jgi:hypothetical protein